MVLHAFSSNELTAAMDWKQSSSFDSFANIRYKLFDFEQAPVSGSVCTVQLDYIDDMMDTMDYNATICTPVLTEICH